MSKGIKKDSMSNLLEGLTSVRTTILEEAQEDVKNSYVSDSPSKKPTSKGIGKEKICTSVDTAIMNKIRAISEKEGLLINELIALGLDMVIGKYEELHGQVRPKRTNKGNIDTIFR